MHATPIFLYLMVRWCSCTFCLQRAHARASRPIEGSVSTAHHAPTRCFRKRVVFRFLSVLPTRPRHFSPFVLSRLTPAPLPPSFHPPGPPPPSFPSPAAAEGARRWGEAQRRAASHRVLGLLSCSSLPPTPAGAEGPRGTRGIP